MAAMDLAKPSKPAMLPASGDWSSASTWQGGRIPDQGSQVLIPEGMIVRLDGEVSSSLEWLRVNGELRFATDRDTELRVDTLVSAPGSRLEIGIRGATSSVGCACADRVRRSRTVNG